MNRLAKLVICIGFVVSACKPIEKNNNDTKFVWVEATGSGRQQVAVFRYDFNLSDEVEIASLNLFADSRYHIAVNGTVLNFGPSRYYPEEPEYDTYNLAPYLTKGKNSIAVKVLNNGMFTYQLVKSFGGFISWGIVKTKNETLNLASPGNWVCKQDFGQDNLTPKMTFAQGAVDVYDARKGIPNWASVDLNISNWQTPKLHNNPNHWGELKPRSIPFLRQDEVLPQHLVAAYTHSKDEDIYSFRMLIPDSTKELFGKNPWALGYTYIYSPVNQKVDIGLWWGEHFLNGKGPLKSNAAKPGKYRRADVTMDLKTGWNYFQVKYGLVWAHWNFHLLLPKNKGLAVSPVKDANSEFFMMTAGPYADDEDAIVKQLELPIMPNELPELSERWIGQKRGHFANNPAIDMVYTYFDKKLDIHPSKITELLVPAKEERTFIFDMGQNTYGRMFVDYSAPEGTQVDIGWAEEMDGDRIVLLKRFGQYMAARHISVNGRNRLETFRPNGHRYLQVTIKHHTDEVILHKVGAIEQNYPLESIGRFECSDRMLTSIWELGKRTTELCADDVYTDPYRERGIYAGDLLPETTLGYVISGDTKLIRKSLQQIQGKYSSKLTKNQTEYDRHGVKYINDFPLITLLNLKWYFDITGDQEFLDYSYPKYIAMMDNLAKEQDDNGLFAPRNIFLEWIQIQKRDVQSTAYQALATRAFEVMSELAEVMNDAPKAKEYLLIAQKSRVALQEKFWDDKRQAFFDGYKDGEKIESYYPVSTAWPVLYNVATDEQIIAGLDFLDAELDSIGTIARHNKTTPYGGYYMLGALYSKNKPGVAEEFMRKEWSSMILDGDDTAWENFGKTDGQGSLSHGWSGGPTWYLSTYVLGVQLGYPEETDLSKITISPQVENISWARGVVPHPMGIVKVDWKVEGDNLFLNYSIDKSKGAKVEVIPRGKLENYQLWVNGKKQ